MRTNNGVETDTDLQAAAPFPGEPQAMLVMRSCLRCGIETTELTCFVCGRATVDEATYDWMTSSNPSGSDC
jgi:hypothetical protein